jgi:hypothetical protein
MEKVRQGIARKSKHFISNNSDGVLEPTVPAGYACVAAVPAALASASSTW